MHGDIRMPNVMVRNRTCADKTLPFLQVVDFDWAGKEGAVRFPFNVSENVYSITKAARKSLIKNEQDQLLVAALIKTCKEKFNMGEEPESLPRPPQKRNRSEESCESQHERKKAKP